MTAPQLRAPGSLRDEVAMRCSAGDRFAGLFAATLPQGVRLTGVLARPGSLDLLDVMLPPGAESYPTLTAAVPAAFWYEREIADVTGVQAEGHPRLEPLVEAPPAGLSARRINGPGMFSIPHGPVRSGVTESIEYLVETPGEDIPLLRVRPQHKRRGVEKRFPGMDPATGVLLAERVEGIASVAHALAYTHAIEDLTDTVAPPAAAAIRLVHAELERIANHLDAATKLAEAAALSVAASRLSWHKERVMRLRGELCGSRYGRGVVTIGGVRAPLALSPEEVLHALAALEPGLARDERALMLTPSFLDRLRGTGPLPHALALRHGALGPIGRASGCGEDVRASRPYGAYRELAVLVAGHQDGDVQTRLQVRWDELHESLRLVRAALHRLAAQDGGWTAPPTPNPVPDGRGVGWAEAPQGEVLYLVECAGGRVRWVKPRSASFHNMVLFHSVFAGDIFTDFPFIEASFGLSPAGVAL